MAISAAMFTADFDAIRTDMQHNVTVSGTTKAAVVSDISLSKQDLQAGGYFPGESLEVVIRLSEWGTVPGLGDTLTTTAYSGKTFRIVRIGTDPSGATRRLFCEGRAQ